MEWRILAIGWRINYRDGGAKESGPKQRAETDAVLAQKIVLEAGKSALARDRFSYAAERTSDKNGDRAAVAEPNADNRQP